MREKKLICLLVAGSLPGFAMADITSDQIKALQARLNDLQKEVKQLRSEVAAKPKAAPVASATPAPAITEAPVDVSSPDYGNAHATLSNDEVASMKQQIASQQLKVDSLVDAANTGPIAGLSVTGYIDPTYIYNRRAKQFVASCLRTTRTATTTSTARPAICISTSRRPSVSARWRRRLKSR